MHQTRRITTSPFAGAVLQHILELSVFLICFRFVFGCSGPHYGASHEPLRTSQAAVWRSSFADPTRIAGRYRGRQFAASQRAVGNRKTEKNESERVGHSCSNFLATFNISQAQVVGELAVALRCAIAVAFGQGVGDSDDSGADRERSRVFRDKGKPKKNLRQSQPQTAARQRTRRAANQPRSNSEPTACQIMIHQRIGFDQLPLRAVARRARELASERSAVVSFVIRGSTSDKEAANRET